MLKRIRKEGGRDCVDYVREQAEGWRVLLKEVERGERKAKTGAKSKTGTKSKKSKNPMTGTTAGKSKKSKSPKTGTVNHRQPSSGGASPGGL